MPAEHFAVAPGWEWWILLYFFFGGIAGGSYALGTMLRLWGVERDEAAARVAFLISFPALIVCPILLTADLGQPLRFHHMLFDTSNGGLAFKFWTPMSVGSWGLTVFGLFSFVSFIEALVLRGNLRWGIARGVARVLRGTVGRVWNILGTIAGLFVAAYTGVLLTVSNQPVWSDGWQLGGLFVASALTASAALLLLFSRRRAAADTQAAIEEADRWFAVIEVVVLAIFVVTVGLTGSLTRMLGPWLLLWVIVVIGILASIGQGSWSRGRGFVVAPVLAHVGALALRALIVFSAQL